MFFGRAPEIQRVVSSLAANALSVLLGGSGTGKTSLVRAGVVPELRNRRYHPRGSLAQWPVLVLRRWGAESGTTIDQILHDQLSIAIDAIDEWGQLEKHHHANQDAALLRSELKARPKGGGIVDTLLRMAARLEDASESSSASGSTPSGLLLVFDQFEELLRPGGQISLEAIRVVNKLYQSGSHSIHILLSLRQEFVYALRPLESTVGGLAARSLVLSPMPEKTVLDVIREASKASDVQIPEDAASRIVGWLTQAAASRDEAYQKEDTSPETEGEFPVDISQTAATPDLLKLQAVLREIFVFARENRKNGVDSEILQEFERSKLAEDSREEKEGQIDERSEREIAERIVDEALERWIEFALKRPLPEEISQGPFGTEGEPSEAAKLRTFKALTDDLSASELYQQVWRMAIRIAPHLTALDYKVPQEENALFRLALGDEVWKLGMKNARNRDKIRIVDEDVPRLNWDQLDISENLVQTEQNYLSGLAKIRGWSPAETGNRLAACFRETLHRLKHGNILTRIVKAGEGEKTSVWELVHDQFGPAFLKWSHKHRDSWPDCESSLTVSSGIQPIVAPHDRVSPTGSERELKVDRISWRGCSLEPGQHRQLVLRNVHFANCYLVGMVFERCRFEDCVFVNCDLNGGLFRECEFRSGPGGGVVFERCDSSSLAIIDSVIYGLEFRDCELQQTTINATLEGDVRITNGSNVALAYFEVGTGRSKKARIVFEKNCRAFFCSADIDSLEKIFYGAQQDVASGALPEGFFQRRSKQGRTARR